MTASPLPRRSLAAAAALLVLALASSAGAAREHAASVRFSTFPRRLAQSDLATVAVAARPVGVVCTLNVRYADARTQSGLNPAVASAGVARWRFHVADDAAPGRAKIAAVCGRAGTVQRGVLVVGSVIPAKIDVVQDGFSVRQDPYGGGSVSYGVILKNSSPNQDALYVYALVNFVGPDNKLVGSATTTVPGIPALAQFALGGDISFFGVAPPISRLEVVVQIQHRQSHALKLPTITNIKVMPSVFEPNWVGSVEGEVSNDQSALVLQNTALSTVVFDAAGNILGGGSGYASASLPPSAREFFKVETGLRAIPIAKAASAMVSAVGTYQSP